MVEITVTDIRGTELTLEPGDCFKAYKKGCKAVMYQFIGLTYGVDNDVYLVNVDSLKYMNVYRDWFNGRRIRKLKRR